MSLESRIALRYLLTKKSHGAVGTISTVSVCAVAIATAAIICVLSVFNGFRNLIAERLDTLAPDIMVTPAQGKVFNDADSVIRTIKRTQGISLATPTLTDNALIINGTQEIPITLKGVIPDEYSALTEVRTLIDKEYGQYLTPGDAQSALFSIGAASRLGALPDTRVLAFAPKRKGRVNLANPLTSFITDSLTISGVYRSNQSQYDEDGVIVPIQTARDLLQYDTEASAIEIKVANSEDASSIADNLRHKLGKKFIVKDRMQQQEMNFRMVEIEKWVSFLLLGFILIIASFNIISSLSMLVLDKERHLSTFAAMGMSRQRIGRIFGWESIYVALGGGIIGIILGLALAISQQEFGFIKIGGDADATIVNSYPVEVEGIDILFTMIPIVAIAIITALITAAFARNRVAISNPK